MNHLKKYRAVTAKLSLMTLICLGSFSAFAEGLVDGRTEVNFSKGCSVGSRTFYCANTHINMPGCSITCGLLPLDVYASCEAAYAIKCTDTGYEIAPASCQCQ